jgi:TonB-linked SusC/RagA family outer membrane protein
MRDAKSTLENFSAQVNYNIDINKHHFKLLAGYQQEVFRYDSFSASKTNFVSDEVPVFNLGSANPKATGDAYQYALQSGFGRLTYDYAEKYLLEVNVRYDGSSRYQDGYRFGTFPSASVGWRFTQEELFKNSSAFRWLSEGKIRASYGSLGNQYGADGPSYTEWFPYLSVLNGVATMPIGNVETTGIAQTVLSNPILQWESATMFNLGLDMGFLNNRLTLTADWFDKRTKDIQLKVPQPDVLGLVVPDQNAGEVSNKGWELALGWNDRAGDFRYGLTAQVADAKNKVLNLGGAPPIIADRITQVGYAIDAFYGYRTNGIAQESDFSIDPVTGKRTPNFPIFAADASRVGPGDLKYADLNGDGVITAGEDREVIGDAFPRYSFSFRGDFGYKNFDMSFFLQGVAKGNGYISGVGIHTFQANGAFPQEVHRDRWTPENTGAWYPRFTYLDTRNTSSRLSEYWLQDASYLRLKNVQLGYTLPKNLTKKWRAERLRLYASAENLFTASDFFYGYDPETATSSGGAYPQVKTITFGINLIFQ